MKTAKILIAHNDLEMEPLLRQTIQELNPEAELTWVKSASEASRLLDADHFALLVTDVFLEGDGSGLDLWHQTTHGAHQTAVLFISEIPVETFLKKVSEVSAPCPAYLSKPFKEGELKQILGGLLNYPDQADQAA